MKIRGKGDNGKRAHPPSPEQERWEHSPQSNWSRRLGRHLLLLFQDDLITQRLQAAHSCVALAGGIKGLKEVWTQIVVVLASAQQVVDDREHAVTNSDDGALGPDAAGQAMVLRREVVLLGVGDDPDDLGQHGAQVPIALGGGRAQPLAAALLVARSHTGPGILHREERQNGMRRRFTVLSPRRNGEPSPYASVVL